MIAHPEPDLDVVNTFGFALPCRRFHFSYSVTHDRRLPVVDEFVLRLLALGAALPGTRIGALLGLSTHELGIVLADLQARDLADIEGEAVRLSRRAADAFHAAEGNPPRIVEVAAWNDAIWIDLVCRNIMVPSRTWPTPNLVPLAAAPESRHVSEDFARSAFERNFRKVVTKVRGTRNPDRFRLYSVASIVPGRFSSVAVKADLRLSLDPSPHTTLVTAFEEAGAGDATGLRQLGEAVQSGVRRLTSASPSAAGLQDLRRLTGDNSVAAFLPADGGGFHLREWLARSGRRSDQGRAAVYGQMYVARNVERLIRELARLPSRSARQEQPKVTWLRPIGSDWGATPDLASAVEAVTRAARPSTGAGGSVQTALLAPFGAKSEMGRFRSFFHAGSVAAETGLASGTEVLAIAGVAAAVLVRVALSSSVILPIGFIVTAPEDVARVERVLIAVRSDREEILWRRDGDGMDAPKTGANASVP